MPTERIIYSDAQTGVEVVQLTNHRCHSNHLYFTNSGWFDTGKKLLFVSDRNNCHNLFEIDLHSYEISQITDMNTERDPQLFTGCINPVKSEFYYGDGDRIYAVSLSNRKVRPLCPIPENSSPAGILNSTVDGRYVCTTFMEDLSDRIHADLNNGSVGFKETFLAHPHCKVVRIDTETGDIETLHEENSWIGHVNTSPTNPHLLSFCHEGPWDQVDCRIWVFDMQTGTAFPVRNDRPDNEVVGHEYWFSDGERIGYHGWKPDPESGKPVPFIGFCRYDAGEYHESCISIPHSQHPNHVHSLDERLIVGDHADSITLWRVLPDGTYDTGRRLCRHRCSFHSQRLHAHPRISPDRTHVLYTSDRTGYGQVYLARIPDDITVLPEVISSH